MTATQQGIDNSPYSSEFDIFGINPADNPAIITLDKSIAKIGDTVTATVSNVPNANGKDCVGFMVHPGNGDGGGGVPSPTYYPPLTGHSGSFSVVVPNVASDWWLNLTFVVWRDCGGVYASSSRVFIPPKAPPVLGAAVAFADPFTPDHRITVCPSGCDYTKPSAAYAAALAAKWDNILVNMARSNGTRIFVA